MTRTLRVFAVKFGEECEPMLNLKANRVKVQAVTIIEYSSSRRELK